MLMTYSISHAVSLYISLIKLYDRTPAVRLCCPRSGQKCVAGERAPPYHQTLNTSASLPPSSLAAQGRLLLVTPLQLACSLWCGLSGEQRHPALLMRCQSVKVPAGLWKWNKKPPGVFMHRLMGGGGGGYGSAHSWSRAGHATNFT